MGIFRHSTLLMQRVEPGATDLDSGTFVVRPADGDGANDKDQEFVLIVFVDQQGGGSVTFDLLTSFGDGLWVRIAQRRLTQDGAKLMIARPMEGFAPYIKVRVRAEPPFQSDVKPTFRAIARLASSGPYKALPATVPNTIEQASTDDEQQGGAPPVGG